MKTRVVEGIKKSSLQTSHHPGGGEQVLRNKFSTGLLRLPSLKLRRVRNDASGDGGKKKTVMAPQPAKIVIESKAKQSSANNSFRRNAILFLISWIILKYRRVSIVSWIPAFAGMTSGGETEKIIKKRQMLKSPWTHITQFTFIRYHVGWTRQIFSYVILAINLILSGAMQRTPSLIIQKKAMLSLLLIFSIQTLNAAPLLRIVGSSAVFPFAATVAEHFSYKTQEPIPLIEAIGTGAGIKLFCSSNGPDGAITSRPFTKGEIEKCRAQGITFEEFKIGQDGLVIILNNREPPFSLTLGNLNEALAEKISEDTSCILNPNKSWDQIQKNFPAYPIRVLGPAPTSGTYDVLLEKILGPCGPYLRHDGAYIEAPANENLIVQKVLNAPHILGIVTFSFYDQNRHRLQAFSINGIHPSSASIQEGDYPLSRPLFLYLKTNDLENVPERALYALEFTSKEAVGAGGYLNEKGLIPLSAQEQEEMHQRALALQQKISKANSNNKSVIASGAKQSRKQQISWIAAALLGPRNDEVVGKSALQKVGS